MIYCSTNEFILDLTVTIEKKISSNVNRSTYKFPFKSLYSNEDMTTELNV